MAKNNMVKWVIGATSVATFTAFVGVAKQFDSTKTNTATASDVATQTVTNNSGTDTTKEEFKATNPSLFGEEEHKGKKHDDEEGEEEGEYSEHGGTTKNSGASVSGNTNTTQISPTSTPRTSTRAS